MVLERGQGRQERATGYFFEARGLTVQPETGASTGSVMLGAGLLDAMHFPLIHLQSEQIHAGDDGLRLATRIVVRDHAALVDVPMALQRSEDELIASGEFDLTHSELGLTPYSVALGALRVADRIHVRYRLVAQRVADASP